MPEKYSQPEIERRWLLELTRLPSFAGVRRREIEDKYVDGGRLRLRLIREQGVETTVKLGKKYGFVGMAPDNVVSIYLDEAEYNTLSLLPGVIARKLRYTLAGGSIDIYEYPALSHAIFEVEFDSEEAAASFIPPEFVGEEITRKSNYSGYSLASRTL
jgi:CYTH domain-containing protein